MSKLDDTRKKINEIDKQMASLFEERMKASEDVAKYKQEHGLSIYDPVREEEVIKKNSLFIKDDVLREYYVSFLKNNMDISKKYQSRLNNGMNIAYSGVEGAYAHIACMKMYKDANYVSYKSFEEAYAACLNGDCDICVLPLENSYAGEVGQVMDLIFNGSLYVNQIIDLEINHCLLGKKGANIRDIKTVISHPQAISQCNEYIKKHNFECVEVENTALASLKVSEGEDFTVASIGSSDAHSLYGLDILESNINASRNNTTRFAAFSRSLNNDLSKGEMGKHFIIVFTVKNEAGALAQTLNIIGSHNFNMRSLRSRPMKSLLWNYYFYVELDGDVNTNDGKEMMKALEVFCDKLKLVGTYKTY